MMLSSRLSFTRSLSGISVNAIAPQATRFYASISEAEKIRRQQELEKMNKQKLAERQKKLKEKIEAKEKALSEKQRLRSEKKLAELKKWEFNQKLKALKERHEAKEIEQREKKRAQEAAKREKEKLKEALKKLNGSEQKKKRDPNAPKRAMTSFLWYVQQNFANFKNELYSNDQNGKVSVTEITKLAKQRFDTLSAEDKNKYEQLAKEDKERYQRERSSYLKRKAADKRPLSPFLLFALEKRTEEVARLKDQFTGRQLQTEIAKALGQRWKSLSDSDKQTYLDQYEKAKEAYTEKHGKKE
jgi:hypothetical protein